MERQQPFSIISHNQISSGRELCFLLLETPSGKSVIHHMSTWWLRINNYLITPKTSGQKVCVLSSKVKIKREKKKNQLVSLYSTGSGSNTAYFMYVNLALICPSRHNPSNCWLNTAHFNNHSGVGLLCLTLVYHYCNNLNEHNIFHTNGKPKTSLHCYTVCTMLPSVQFCLHFQKDQLLYTT